MHHSSQVLDPRALVVHCRRQPFDVYIGRDNPSLGLRDIGFSNRYSHKAVSSAEVRVATRQEAIEQYEAWVLTQPALLERIRRELAGKRLGCWCAPLPCHGEVLVRLANNLTRPAAVRDQQISLF